MRILAIAATLAAFSTAQDPTQDPVFAPKAAFKSFQAEAGGTWLAQWHAATGTPSAIYGTGLKLAGWGENSLAAARVHANAQLQKHAALLGLGTSTCMLHINPVNAIGFTTVGAGAGSGSATFVWQLPPTGGYQGLSLYTQWVVFDPLGPSASLTTTGGLRSIVAPFGG